MISVCIATYNGERFIYPQIKSILSQLGPHDEVIISDDHSEDNTVDIVRKFEDSRVRIIFNDKSCRGYTKNFENALRHSQGEFIFLSDQDDIWREDKVAITMKALQRCDFTVSDANVVDENLQTIQESHFLYSGVKQGFVENFLRTRYIGACMAFHKKVLNVALPFPSNNQLCAHDYWITLVAECYFKVELIQLPLIYYRRHHSNVSTGGLEESKSTLIHKIVKRIYCALFLASRYMKVEKR